MKHLSFKKSLTFVQELIIAYAARGRMDIFICYILSFVLHPSNQISFIQL